MELENRLAALHRDLDAYSAAAGSRLRHLQRSARQLRQSESAAQFAQILAAAALPFASAVSFFRVDGETLHCESTRGIDAVPEPVPLSSAPALRQAVETRETVVCLANASQLGVAAPSAPGRRAHVFPLNGRTRVLGILLTGGENEPDVYSLEILLTLAAAALELRETRPVAPLIAPAPLPPPPPSALRFARATVARWLLDVPAAIATGRAQADLYAQLRPAIDAARAEYRRRYLPGPDHLHAEILSRLALGRPALLGPNYPGALEASAHG